MMGLLAWAEATPVAAWVREDFYAYFVLLILHAWGMALFVGGGIAVNLRLLGVAGAAPAARFAGFFPWIRIGVVLAVISGLGLLAGYPAKALTNWVFPLKLVLLVAGGVLLWRGRRALFADAPVPGARWRAALSLALLLAGVAAGKLLLYTYSMLMTTD